MLLEAAEQAGIAPIRSPHLHAFAYLADVLSPISEISPFDGKIYKSPGGPRYPDMQLELDRLVVMGLVQVRELHFENRADHGARISGSYGLNFGREGLKEILGALGAGDAEEAIVPSDRDLHVYLVNLAGALATLPGNQIDAASDVDVTYQNRAGLYNVVDFAEWVEDTWEANPSWQVAERFEVFIPEASELQSDEKLYLYATYLEKFINEQ